MEEKIICEECQRVIRPGDLPVVIEWGEKTGDPTLTHIGKPVKRGVHLVPCAPHYFAKHPVKKSREPR